MKRSVGRERIELRNVVHTVRRRWRTRNFLRGVLLSAVAGMAALLIVGVLQYGPRAWTGGEDSHQQNEGQSHFGN